MSAAITSSITPTPIVAGSTAPSQKTTNGLIWTDLPPESYHKARGGKYNQEYFFKTTVTAEVALKEFGIEIPQRRQLNERREEVVTQPDYELNAKIADPDPAHIREVLQATIALQKAINACEVARIASQTTGSNNEFAKTLAHEYLANLKKIVAEDTTGILCPSYTAISYLDSQSIVFFTAEQRAFLLEHKKFVDFGSTMKSLIESGLTQTEQKILFNDPYYLFNKEARELLATASQKEAVESKKA